MSEVIGDDPIEAKFGKKWDPAEYAGKVVAYRLEGSEYYPIVVDDYGNEVNAIWAPIQNSSQSMFLQAPEFEALYEGTRGPGKTLTLLMDFCQDVGKGWGPEWKGMIIRRTYPELADVIAMSKKWIKRIWPGAFYNEVKYFWQFPEGELLYFRPIATIDDYDAHHGTNYTWLGWEELTLWADPGPFKRMQSVVRSSMKGIPLRIRSTTNPYGKGHNWVQARYQLYNWPIKIGRNEKQADPILRDRFKVLGPLITNSVDEAGVKEPPRRAYHGSLCENILLLRVQPNYVSQLKGSARNKAELDAWLFGSWDIAAGGMFDDIWSTHRDAIVLPDFQIPWSWPIRRAYDHGSSKPWSCGWYAESDGSDIEYIDPQTGQRAVRATLKGDMFRVGECYGWQKDQPNVGRRMLIPEISKEIIEYEISRGWRDPNTGKTMVRRGPADTSIFDEVDGRPSVALDFEAPVVINGHRWRGIIWEKADKGPGSREQGWEQARKRLKATKRAPGGIRETPGLFVVGPRCPQWLRTVPTLPRDEKKIDDVDTEAEDHIGDEMRYMLRYEAGVMRTRRQ